MDGRVVLVLRRVTEKNLDSLPVAIPGHVFGPGRAGPGRQKARLKNLLPRPGPARLSGRVLLPKPGPSGQKNVGLSGRRAGPS
jgi:hypothetical protein